MSCISDSASSRTQCKICCCLEVMKLLMCLPDIRCIQAFTMNIQKYATDFRDDECSKQRDKQQQTNDSSYSVPTVAFLSTAVVTGCWGGWRLNVIKLSCLWGKYLTGHIIFAITPTWFYRLYFYCPSDISKYTHSPTYAIAMFQKLQHKSNFAQEQSIHMVN